MNLRGLLNLTAALFQQQEDRPLPSPRDLERAAQPRPTPASHVHGRTAAEAFAGEDHYNAVRCDSFRHEDLDAIFETVYALRAPELDAAYAARGDRRGLHFESLDYKRDLWVAEQAAEFALPSHRPGGSAYNATRDGKCAEIVMVWVHHLTEAAREGAKHALDVPLLPAAPAAPAARSEEYAQQIGCTSCHVAVHLPGEPPVAPIPMKKNSSKPQYATSCPLVNGKPTVYYDRTKRCDWDYEDPPCAPCEGVGGMIWGPGEDDWLPMPCEVVAEPAAIDPANLTSPLWPKHFTVDEYAALTFPGADPCDVNFKNSTYTLEFDTDEATGLPTYHSIGHSGPQGPSPFPGKAWALPDGNFYVTVDLAGRALACACVSPRDPVVDHAITGPLSFDFNRGAKLIGRERIRPEYVSHDLIADHWAKGPHHFWIDVQTNLMVREWQPFNGLQTYYNWNLSKPDVTVDEICTKGFLKFNISCIAPAPA